MSFFDIQGTSPPSSPRSQRSFSNSLDSGAVALMGDSASQSQQHVSPSTCVDAHRDARAVIRLVQCSQCSLPLRLPITLPCGNSLCRSCVPELHTRENISHPMTDNRQEEFRCPFDDCGIDHSLGDCSQDVTLTKLMDRISIEVVRSRRLNVETPTQLEERPSRKTSADCSRNPNGGHSRILNGGRLLATYTMAELGELDYDSEVSYQTMSPTGDDYQQLDTAMLDHLKESSKNELDCQVCYGLLLDPLTTPCGHTFCRKCVARVLDHSRLCPVCRRQLFVRPGAQHEASNRKLLHLLAQLCPDQIIQRAEVAAQEELAMQGDQNVPLFPCTLGYPGMPTFLHIFEPRYRLMIRRAVENGNRKFGMMMYNRRGLPQGELGITPFMLYGTLLHIISVEMLSDGRSLIETRGVTRFRVKEWAVVDGYIVGNIERLRDLLFVEEEQLEASETSVPPSPTNDLIAQLDRTSTSDLLKIGTDFVSRMRAASAPWLHERVIASYGPSPSDPALFPYWFASILPIADDEKYKLLPTNSVRERLKLTARWVRRIEAQQW